MSISQHKTTLFELYTQTIEEFLQEYIHIDCQPVGQRLPVHSQNNSKEAGIIQSIFNEESIGMITLMEITEDMNRKERRAFERTYKKESIDGGHRKRGIWAFLQNKLRVPYKKEFLYFNQLPKEIQEEFLDMELSFTLYKPLSTERKGRIFRNSIKLLM